MNINVHNVNQGLAEGLRHLAFLGKPRASRNGPVLMSKEPVITTYADPTARVLFSPMRDANPFFHLMEALWMLAGRNDVAWLNHFTHGIARYSDDGRTLHGAYGYRWREQFKFDQLPLLVDLLKSDPDTRRAVLTMWEPQADFNALGGLDVPCNTHVYFDIGLDGRLNATICNRSNDIWWGLYGANAVHFSVLLEYMAAAVGVPVGVMRTLSNNFHLYPAALNHAGGEGFSDHLETLTEDVRYHDRYTFEYGPHVKREPWKPGSQWYMRRVPLVMIPGAFDEELYAFMEEGAAVSYTEPFFIHVACPMLRAWDAYKAGEFHVAEAHAEQIRAEDWSRACVEWLERRNQARLAKERAAQ